MLILMMIEDLLADLGCESVATAATNDKALAMIDAQTFDVVMLDMNLNGNQTYPVADALAARDVPFVFSTGYGVDSIRDDYCDRPVLMKPFRGDELGDVLARLLAND